MVWDFLNYYYYYYYLIFLLFCQYKELNLRSHTSWSRVLLVTIP